MAETRTTTRNWLLVEPLLASVLWGGVFTAAKVGMQEIPVLAFTTVRILLGAGLLLGVSGGFRWLRTEPPIRRPLLVAGLAQMAFQVLFMQGIHQTTVSISAILLACAPLLTAAWLAATRQERLAHSQWAGLGLGLGGVALVMGADGFDSGGTLTGNLLALGAALAWAWYGLTIGALTGAVGSVRAAGGTVGLAAIVLAPFGAREMSTVAWDQVSIGAWAGLIYGAVLGLALATGLWVRSVERWGTQASMNYGYVEPIAAVAIAAVLLHESLQPIQAVGAALALVGVYLAAARRAKAG